jgi:RNA polymerase sigma-70 factor (ECF subfamily)
MMSNRKLDIPVSPYPGGSPGPTLSLVPSPTPKPEPESSFELVRRACHGDKTAENLLAERYLPRLKRWAKGRLPRGARAAMETGDLVHDVFMRAVRGFPTFDPRHEGSFPAYIRKILANRLHDLGRVEKRRPQPDPLESGVDAPAPERSPFDEAVGEENRRRFDAAFSRLDVEDQDLIFMRMELGYSYEDIAAMLGRPTPNAIRVATRRAMLRLAKEMSSERP